MSLVTKLREELLKLMAIKNNSDCRPAAIVCRWCGAWLEYSDDSIGKPEEIHMGDCIAATLLNRPTKKKSY